MSATERLGEKFGGTAVTSSVFALCTCLADSRATHVIVPATASPRVLTAARLAGCTPIIVDVTESGGLDAATVAAAGEGLSYITIIPPYQWKDGIEGMTLGYQPDVLEIPEDRPDYLVIGLETLVGAGAILVTERPLSHVYKDWWGAVDDLLPEVVAELALGVLESQAWEEMLGKKANYTGLLQNNMLECGHDSVPYLFHLPEEDCEGLLMNGLALPAWSYLPSLMSGMEEMPNALQLAKTHVCVPLFAPIEDLTLVENYVKEA